MALIKASKTAPRRVEVCSVRCEGEQLDATLKSLNSDGWNIRQVYQELPSFYRLFCQRDFAVREGTA